MLDIYGRPIINSQNGLNGLNGFNNLNGVNSLSGLNGLNGFTSSNGLSGLNGFSGTQNFNVADANLFSQLLNSSSGGLANLDSNSSDASALENSDKVLKASEESADEITTAAAEAITQRVIDQKNSMTLESSASSVKYNRDT